MIGRNSFPHDVIVELVEQEAIHSRLTGEICTRRWTSNNGAYMYFMVECSSPEVTLPRGWRLCFVVLNSYQKQTRNTKFFSGVIRADSKIGPALFRDPMIIFRKKNANPKMVVEYGWDSFLFVCREFPRQIRQLQQKNLSGSQIANLLVHSGQWRKGLSTMMSWKNIGTVYSCLRREKIRNAWDVVNKFCEIDYVQSKSGYYTLDRLYNFYTAVERQSRKKTPQEMYAEYLCEYVASMAWRSEFVKQKLGSLLDEEQ